MERMRKKVSIFKKMNKWNEKMNLYWIFIFLIQVYFVVQIIQNMFRIKFIHINMKSFYNPAKRCSGWNPRHILICTKIKDQRSEISSLWIYILLLYPQCVATSSFIIIIFIIRADLRNLLRDSLNIDFWTEF